MVPIGSGTGERGRRLLKSSPDLLVDTHEDILSCFISIIILMCFFRSSSPSSLQLFYFYGFRQLPREDAPRIVKHSSCGSTCYLMITTQTDSYFYKKANASGPRDEFQPDVKGCCDVFVTIVDTGK
jgi:hypothetical protein